MIGRSLISDMGWVYRCPKGHYVYASTKRPQVIAALKRHEETCDSVASGRVGPKAPSQPPR